ncbi:cell wall metabolism sensor histidine kinase WalK [Shinella sp. HZN7]|uniref:sensor histidine kinase n=1 Tax=Shinella sp. (strain HZN7) TaxID=879274 RepID=UPI000A079DF6|nr:ATP-binding protein [Shinella sp. HZN7]
MMLWWKKSLAGQFIVFILAALFVGQTIAFLVSSRQREAAIRQSVESDFVNRTAALSSVLEAVPADMRRNVLIASSTGYARFWLSDRDPSADPHAWYETAQSYLRASASDLIRSQAADGSAPVSSGAAPSLGDPDITGWHPFAAEPAIPHAQFLHFSSQEGMGIVQRLNGNSWLNAVYYKPSPPYIWSSQSMLSIGITAVVLSLIGVLVARRIARPLRRLTISAEALGRGEAIQLSPPRAPDDIRQLYEAFDRMQLRLRRFVDDRTRMLAAIGHDLRTPLTTLRLKAEFVSDPDLQSKILATVDEMQTMTEAALSFAKSEATVEKTRTVDLAALLGSLCDDLAELGHDVVFQETDRISYRCRPDNLKRAVRNLIENALRYAGRAAVRVETRTNAIEILIEDEGPGIPPSELEQVFTPFYRVESSRNRETGGVGLGLSIARAIARHHGGDIVLSPNNPGLKAAVVLPVL